jgi:hypothetical protein
LQHEGIHMGEFMKLHIVAALAAVTVSAFAAPAFAQCRDPWVSQAVREVQGRPANGTGELGECNIKLYGNGSWSSYPDLLGKVRARYPRMGGGVQSSAGVLQAPYGANGAGMVAAGGGNMVAAGGGNMVAAGGLNRGDGR